MKYVLSIITAIALMSMVGAFVTIPALAVTAHNNLAAAREDGEIIHCRAIHHSRFQ